MPSVFANPWALSLAWLFSPLCLLAAWARYRRQRKLAQFGSRLALRELAAVRRSRRFVRSFCFGAGLLALMLAIAGPQWGYQPTPTLATGRDLVVVLDMSRSMLAEDVLPNRLERAKQSLGELADALQKHGGHRVGLVAFAGRARVVCPLTPDYDHFRTAVATLEVGDPRLAPGQSDERAVSGTRIGIALKLATELQDDRFHGHQDILLLSDGDDPAQDEEWRQGASAARSAGIPIFTVGIGDPDRESSIPDREGRPLRHDNKEVGTRLQEGPLEGIAQITGGVYTPARLEVPPMAELFRFHMQGRPGREFSDDVLPTLKPRYPWFFGAAFVLLVMSMLIHDRKRPRGTREAVPRKTTSVVGALRSTRRSPVSTSLLLLAFVLLSAGPPADPLDLVRAGNTAFEAAQYELAVAYYTRAEEYITDPGLVAFNKAAALYHLGRYREAELHYLRCSEDAAGGRRARVLFDLGNVVLQQSRGQDARLLDRAIRFYEACMRSQGLTPELKDDVTFNLRLAKQLRERAKPTAADANPTANQKTEDPNERERPPRSNGSNTTDQAADPREVGLEKGAGKLEAGKTAKTQLSSRPVPGVGNLPPVPDDEKLAPLSQADALAHLQRVAEQLEAERKRLQQRSTPVARNIPDW